MQNAVIVIPAPAYVFSDNDLREGIVCQRKWFQFLLTEADAGISESYILTVITYTDIQNIFFPSEGAN